MILLYYYCIYEFTFHFSYDIIDFWDLKKFKYKWPTEEDGPLFDNFYPCGYEKALVESGCPVKHGIFVQAVNNTVAETGNFRFFNSKFIVAGYKK